MLPSSFEELPDVVRQHLAGIAFVAPPKTVNVDEVMQLSRGIPMRSTHRTLTLQRQMQQSASFGSGGFHATHLVEAAALMASAALRSPVADHPAGLTNLQIFGRQGSESTGAPKRQLQDLLERHEASAVTVAPAASASAGQVTAPLAIMDMQPSRLSSGSAAGVNAAVPHAQIESLRSATSLIESKTEAAQPSDGSQEVQPTAKPEQDVQPVESVLTQDAMHKAPSQVASTVERLALAHYGLNLDTSMEQPPKKRGRPPNALKRPAAAPTSQSNMKRPAAAASSHASLPNEKEEEVASLKKPACASLKKPAGKKKAKAAKAAKAAKDKKTVTKAQRMKLKPHGCSTCRHTAGCCPSCWTKQGYEVLS